MKGIDALLWLCHRRWTVPALAELSRRNGAKFVTLVNATGASAGALRSALDALIEAGWVAPNPGYGHPLRPEYILTRRGERLGPRASALDEEISSLGVRDVAYRRWSMPVLGAIGNRPRRFSEIARRVEGITDRSLSLALQDLAGAALVSRDLVDERPPAAAYRLTDGGKRLVGPLARLL